MYSAQAAFSDRGCANASSHSVIIFTSAALSSVHSGLDSMASGWPISSDARALIFISFWPHHVDCGISVSARGLNRVPRQ